jgi:hypothetical protein
MIPRLVALTALAVACASAPLAAAAPKETAAAPGLTFDLAQVASATDLTIRFVLRNGTLDRTFWINRRARIGQGDDWEIDVRLMDGRGRRVGSRCTDDLQTIRPASDFGSLPPGQKLELSYRFDPHCWSLAPGEPLSAIASFTHLEDVSPPPPAGTFVLKVKVTASDWKTLQVPRGWKDHYPPRP